MKAIIVNIIIFLLTCFIPANADIRISGASTILPVISKIAPIFEKQTGIKIKYKGGGSSKGLSDLRNQLSDIAMVSRVLSEKEREGNQVNLIAYDAVAITANQNNPVKSLTTEQIRKIFTSQIINWSSLTNLNHTITPIIIRQGRATRKVFDQFFKLENHTFSNNFVIGPNMEGIAFVASDPSAIGYVSVGEVVRLSKLGMPIKAIPIDGIEATKKNILSGLYPLKRPLNLLNTVNPNDEVKLFYQFIQQTPTVKDIIINAGYLPILNVSGLNESKLNAPKFNAPKLNVPKLNAPKLNAPKLNGS